MTCRPTSNRRFIAAALLLACAAGTGRTARAGEDTPITPDNLPDAVRTIITDHFRQNLLIPELALWKFDFTRRYPTGGLSVCGRVNYTNSTRRYLGDRQFYARMIDGKVNSAAIVSTNLGEDPVRATLDAYNVACRD